MCGIAGIVGSGAADEARLSAMLAVLAHRGPDGEGRHRGQEIALGHRRLSIIDVAGGAQPLSSSDGKCWLVANGEIYNYRELRAELDQAGIALRTESDCEVILGLYRLYGDELLSRLRGMFAFALWDADRRRLLMARDHLGQKPLFYASRNGGLLFASEIKALLAADGSLRAPDLRALDQYLALRLIAPPLTMFRDIKKLPPGHKLVFEPGAEPQISRYWNLRYEPKLERSEDDLLDELEALTLDSLRHNLISDVEVGAYLSGGLDSSLIVAMVCQRLGVKSLKTFTLSLPYARYSEGPAAKAVSQAFGTVHHEQVLTASLLEHLPDLVWHLDEPSDPLSLCSFVLAEHASQQVKVVVGGDGGDELFAGYDRYAGFRLAGLYRRVPAPLRRALCAANDLLPDTGWYKSRSHKLRWMHQAAQLEGSRRYSASLSYFHFEEQSRRQLYGPAVRESLRGWRGESVVEAAFDATPGDWLDRMLYTDSTIRLPDHPVMISDRMSMAHGLEVRSPFMDHELAMFCARLPNHFKIRGRRLRYFQYRLCERYLPASVLRRPKQGFASALPYMFRDELDRLYSGTVAASQMARDGLLDQARLDELRAAHRTGRSDHGTRLWLIANLELWYRMSILGHTREQLRDELAALGRREV